MTDDRDNANEEAPTPRTTTQIAAEWESDFTVRTSKYAASDTGGQMFDLPNPTYVTRDYPFAWLWRLRMRLAHWIIGNDTTFVANVPSGGSVSVKRWAYVQSDDMTIAMPPDVLQAISAKPRAGTEGAER